MKRFESLKTACAAVALAWGGAAFADAPNYADDVEPILRSHCVSCHRPNEIAPMSFLTYDEVRPWAKSIRKTVAAREMPPFHADKGDYAFANDISLPQETIDKVVAWVDAGAPAGDLAKVPPPPQSTRASEWLAGEPDFVLDIGADHVVRGDVDDEYRCFVLKPEFEHDVWMQGIEYLPGNRRVVHHIMAYAEPTRTVRDMPDPDPEPGFPCGMSGAGGGTQRLDMLLGGWAPGTPPNMFPIGTGKVIPAGADIVYQCHYHNETGEDQTDRSKMGFHFATEPIRAQGRIGVVGTFFLNIPAGNPAVEHTGRWRAPYDLDLFGVMPHMHYIGKAMKVTATFPDGAVKTLVDVPRFDFNWQMVYSYKEPIRIPKGTQFHMTAVHDNSADNPANPSNPPRDMAWGEATDEEMAHCWLTIVKADENLGIAPKPPTIGSAPATGTTAGGL